MISEDHGKIIRFPLLFFTHEHYTLISPVPVLWCLEFFDEYSDVWLSVEHTLFSCAFLCCTLDISGDSWQCSNDFVSAHLPVQASSIWCLGLFASLLRPSQQLLVLSWGFDHLIFTLPFFQVHLCIDWTKYLVYKQTSLVQMIMLSLNHQNHI